MYPEMKINDFLEVLGSKAPTPGGGGASAVCGAIGAALCMMVCNLTTGKKKFAEYEPDLTRIIAKANELKNKLAALSDADAEVFAPLAAAYSLPTSTEAEIKYKTEIMESALMAATSVPLNIMELACECVDLHEELSTKCSKLAISDVGVGVSMCRSALLSASLNVYINTKLMTNTETAAALNDKADKLLKQYTDKADRVFERVLNSLK